MARSFADILSYEGDDFEEAYGITFNVGFTAPFGETKYYNLKEDGENIPVTKENRKVRIVYPNFANVYHNLQY